MGCIYNYFGSKTELVSAAVESIWNDIFHHPEDETVFQDTLSCIRWMYRQMEYGCQQYPGLLHPPCAGLCAAGHCRWQAADAADLAAHSGRFVQRAAPRCQFRPDAFTEQFTPEQFAGILFSLMLSAVVQQSFDPSAVLEIVRRTIY